MECGICKSCLHELEASDKVSPFQEENVKTCEYLYFAYLGGGGGTAGQLHTTHIILSRHTTVTERNTSMTTLVIFRLHNVIIFMSC